jgi:FKBP-type peptidyl-prolyl cis-trans isomerase (trigger factor)
MTKKTTVTKLSESVAKSEDGSIQITFSIPTEEIDSHKDEAAKEFVKEVEVPGFRKGMAPLSKVIEHVGEQKILEHALSHMLPKMFADAVEKHKLKPNIYPKFEVLNSGDSKVLQVRANTCEIQEFDLGNYKEKIKSVGGGGELWTPDKGDPGKKKISPEEKSQQVIKVLLENIKVVIPKMLIDDEVNGRLSRLLEKIDKLGLTLESYLSSVGKNVQGIREEYEKQSREAIALDLILTKIAEKENLKVTEDELKGALKAASADPNMSESNLAPENRRVIELILLRRKALDFLANSI